MRDHQHRGSGRSAAAGYARSESSPSRGDRNLTLQDGAARHGRVAELGCGCRRHRRAKRRRSSNGCAPRSHNFCHSESMTIQEWLRPI